MKFGKKYSRFTVILALLHGVLIGVIALVLVVVIFTVTGKEAKQGVEAPKEIPTMAETPEEKPDPVENTSDSLTLFANQYGAFTTLQGAETFIASDSSLKTAAIVEGEGQFHVWSHIATSQNRLQNVKSEESFIKTFTVSEGKCDAFTKSKLWEILASDQLLKLELLDAEKTEETAQQFIEKYEAITAFTDDLAVLKLHLIAHYSKENGCVIISF